MLRKKQKTDKMGKILRRKLVRGRTIGLGGCAGSGGKRNQLFPSSGEQLIVHWVVGTAGAGSNHNGKAQLITVPLR